MASNVQFPGENLMDVADYIELAVFAARRERLSRSKIEEIVTSANGEVDDDELIEQLTGRALAEFRRRAQVAGSGYPFDVSEDAVRLQGDAPTAVRRVYLFLLLLATSPACRRRKGTVWPDRVFEQLTSEALAQWSGGRALVFAEMATGQVGIRAALAKLGEELGLGNVQPGLARPQRKDHGLDVVAWRPFRDRSDGVPLLLCQCTVGRGDLIAKARETVSTEWSQLLSINVLAISTALSIPHVLAADYVHWWELKANTELILDRLRLLELLVEQPKVGATGGLDACLEVMTECAPSGLERHMARV